MTQGGDKIDLINAYTGIRSPNDRVEYTIATASNYVKVIVEAMAPSTAINDVTITVRWGEAQDRAVDIIDYKTTVWTPTMVPAAGVQDYPYGGGYLSVYEYKVLPALLTGITNLQPIYIGLPVNEAFSGHWDDPQWMPPGVVNWAIRTGNTSTNSAACFSDNLAMTDGGPPQHPTPVSPIDLTPVTGYSLQLWRGGSLVSGDGVPLESAKVFTLFLGAGRRQ